MGRVTTTIIVTDRIDEILAERGFIPTDEIRSVTLDNVLVDTGASALANLKLCVTVGWVEREHFTFVTR
ncbi:MAG: hypothetical protein F6J93_25885 [Oscillatoria sp. SIO1A7]|nr:hypothetical protein [Oscillatoria sp. SIO1A7]